jgi:hypothetical protein
MLCFSQKHPVAHVADRDEASRRPRLSHREHRRHEDDAKGSYPHALASGSSGEVIQFERVCVQSGCLCSVGLKGPLDQRFVKVPATVAPIERCSGALLEQMARIEQPNYPSVLQLKERAPAGLTAWHLVFELRFNLDVVAAAVSEPDLAREICTRIGSLLWGHFLLEYYYPRAPLRTQTERRDPPSQRMYTCLHESTSTATMGAACL